MVSALDEVSTACPFMVVMTVVEYVPGQILFGILKGKDNDCSVFGLSAKGGSENISVLVGLQLSGCAGPDSVNPSAMVCAVFAQDLSVQLTSINPPSSTVEGDTPSETYWQATVSVPGTYEML
jgi:hypothetical protein